MHTLVVDFGNGVVAGTGQPVGILDYEGLVSVPTQGNIVEHALLDGGYVASVRAATRRLTFELDFADTCSWADVGRLFPSGATLPLAVTRDGVTRRIQAVRDSEIVALGGRGALDPVAVQLALLAPEPYFSGTDVVQQTNVTSVGLEHPYAHEPTIVYDDLDMTGTSQVFDTYNLGDHPVPFRLSVSAASVGDLTVSVEGASMVVGVIAKNDEVEIDMARQTITINGANGFPLLQSGNFLKLPAGHGLLELDGIIGYAVVTFTPVFEGV